MWIDARDEVPIEAREVLVYNEEDGCSVGYHIGGHWSVLGHGDNQPVTHWQPLPAPPSKREPKSQTAMVCRECVYWNHGECYNSHSPKFTSETTATDGCTPNKKARADWI